MRWIPDRVIRSWGLVLVATGLLAWCASLIVAGAEADDAAFERAVGWANIAGALLGSIGVVMVAVDKLLELYDVSPQRLATEMERIAREELDSEQRARAQLLGLDGPEIVAANVRFERELIQFCDAGGQTVGDLDGILSYYDGLSPRRLVILGQPGAGKTVLAVELTLRLLEQCEASGFDRSRVPLRMSLASLPADRSVEDWLIQHLKREFRLRNRIACAIVRQRRLIPVLDGLDEMDSQTGPAARAQDVVTKLNTYLAGRDLAAIVVTCRTERYEQLPIAIGSATNVYVQPLDAPTTVAYLAAVTRNAAEAAAWTPVVIAMKSEPMHPLPCAT